MPASLLTGILAARSAATAAPAVTAVGHRLPTTDRQLRNKKGGGWMGWGGNNFSRTAVAAAARCERHNDGTRRRTTRNEVSEERGSSLRVLYAGEEDLLSAAIVSPPAFLKPLLLSPRF